MARPLRIEYPGAYVHITARGVARHDIFLEAEDREVFLTQLGHAHHRWGLVFHGYCLMSNHYHLEVECPHGHLSRAMQWVNQTYASYINRRYDRVGHLFQGRFKSVLIEVESHLHVLTRYIHLNPVRAGLVKHPIEYPWSSYACYLGLRERPAWLEVSQILKKFGHTVDEQRRGYREFVEQDVVDDPLQAMRFGAILGSERFVESAREQLRETETNRDIAQLHKARPRAELAAICHVVKQAYGLADSDLRAKGRKRNECRDVAIYLAREHSGCALESIGKQLGGISPAAVSLAHKRVAQKLSQEVYFQQQIERLTEEIKRL